ncbi:MAG: ABC transporter permease [Proteobacteria bacterium]|nr:ABC transporter permease [Pseudomonadota bacterium]
MFDLDRWTEIGDALRKNKLRTALTALGVFWGMFMLVVMLGFGNGLENGVKGSMMRFTTNVVYVWGERTTMAYRGFQPGREVDFTNADIAAIRRVPGVEYVAPRNQLGGHRSSNVIRRGSKTGSYQVLGETPDFFKISPRILVSGRFINPLDLEEKRKTAVIGQQVAAELFEPGEDPVGHYISVQGGSFLVVGVFRMASNDDRSDRENSTIHVPFSTFQHVFNYGERVSWFAIGADDDTSAGDLEDRVRAELADRHHVHPDDPEGIGGFNSEREFGKVSKLFGGIRFFVWFVGVMTLAAGVVGVSNILLIVVKERTKEIGLRRALGATPFSVVSMIVQEAVTLTAVSGYAGLVAGVALLEVASMALGEDSGPMSQPGVDLSTALAAGVVLLFAGALAGVIPARNAAAISPVEALHSE